MDCAERDEYKPVLRELSLAGNLVKPLLSLNETEWRERGYGLCLLTSSNNGMSSLSLSSARRCSTCLMDLAPFCSEKATSLEDIHAADVITDVQ
jgi:hypothetical protein